jgi:hypothetical protein
VPVRSAERRETIALEVVGEEVPSRAVVFSDYDRLQRHDGNGARR